MFSIFVFYDKSRDPAITAFQIKQGIISELVKDEDPKNPLSDKEIVELLSAKGIPIARRTVAKYRNELGILPSNMRKTY